MKRITLYDLRQAADDQTLQFGVTVQTVRIPTEADPAMGIYVAGVRDGLARPLGVVVTGHRDGFIPRVWRRLDLLNDAMFRLFGPAYMQQVAFWPGAGQCAIDVFIKEHQIEVPDVAYDESRRELLDMLRGRKTYVNAGSRDPADP